MGLTTGTVELVVNGDFSGGNTGFSSEHNYCNTSGCLLPEGMYSVGVDPSFYQTDFVGADHTTGSGNFMILNGATVAGKKVWCQTVPVTTNTVYIFSYWVSSMTMQSPATLQTKINNINFYMAFGAPFGTGTWLQFSGVYNSGANTSAEICIYDTNVDGAGNDFGVDDISFKECVCDISIEAGTGGSICKGDSIQLDGSGAASYFWGPSAGLSCINCEDPMASPSTTTTYTVSVNGIGNCQAFDSVTVIVFPTLDLHAAPDTSICAGESVQLNADGILNYEWMPQDGLSDPFIPDPVATPSATTTYFVHGIDEHGCNQSDSLTIEIFPQGQPVSVTANPQSVCEGDTISLTASGGDLYSWKGLDYQDCDCPEIAVVPQESQSYEVSAIDSNGCFAGSDSVAVHVDAACSSFGIPTAFSPNADGKNDVFRVLGKLVTSVELSVYNRWGELIFTTNNPLIGWDGTYKGTPQPIGVYVYTVKASLADGRQINENGNVTLIR